MFGEAETCSRELLDLDSQETCFVPRSEREPPPANYVHQGVLPPCRVCNKKSSGFHYGAYTCEGCKVFFRRSLRRATHYTCLGDKRCLATNKRRGGCQFCRFKRCTDSGMSIEAIRHGRYTHSVRTMNILEMKARKKMSAAEQASVTEPQPASSPDSGIIDLWASGQTSGHDISSLGSSCSSLSSSPRPSPRPFSFADFLGRDVILRMDDMLDNIDAAQMTSGIHPLQVAPNLMKAAAAYAEVYGCHPISWRNAYLHHPPPNLTPDMVACTINRWFDSLETGLTTFVKFLKKIDIFNRLPLEIQTRLIVEARSEIFLLAMQAGTNLDKGTFTTYIMDTMPLSEFYGHWDHDLFVQILKFSERLKTLRLTLAESKLLLMLVIFTPDRGCVTEAHGMEEVEKMREFLIYAMQVQTEQVRPGDKTFLARVMQVVTDLRSHGQVVNVFLARLKHRYPSINATGIVNELYLDR